MTAFFSCRFVCNLIFSVLWKCFSCYIVLNLMWFPSFPFNMRFFAFIIFCYPIQPFCCLRSTFHNKCISFQLKTIQYFWSKHRREMQSNGTLLPVFLSFKLFTVNAPLISNAFINCWLKFHCFIFIRCSMEMHSC